MTNPVLSVLVNTLQYHDIVNFVQDLALATNAQNFSYRLKMSESADLTTCELVSRHTGYKPNNALSGMKHLGIHDVRRQPAWYSHSGLGGGACDDPGQQFAWEVPSQ